MHIGDEPKRSSAIKSITIEHVEIEELDVKDIIHYAYTPDDDCWNSKVRNIVGFTWCYDVPHFLRQYPQLEQLILVDFEIDPAEEGRVYRRRDFDEPSGMVEAEWEPATEEESIRMFVETFEHGLKWQGPGKSILRKQVPPAPKNVSKWWGDPKVTRMTKEEFNARFS
jgi:hypothetical protein